VKLTLEEVFPLSLGLSTGQDTALFKRYKTFCTKTVITDYKPGVIDTELAARIHGTAFAENFANNR